jgi:hypothetical protein
MDWLTREDIDRVLDTLSADDLIEATDAGAGKGARIAGLAFHQAAVRVLGPLPDGEKYTQRVRAGDFQYLANRISGEVNIDSPLSESTSALLSSEEPGT